MSETRSRSRDGARAIACGDLALFVVVFLVGIAGSTTFALLDVDEPRFATASRAMFRMEPGENWIVPHWNGGERFDKPILVYWLQALAMHLFGPWELAARLPSALAIAGAATLVAGIGRLFGLRGVPAFLAGLATGTCGLAVVMAHAATADALLFFCTTLCARFQIGRFVKGPSAASFSGLWLALSAAFLAKGPVAWLCPIALGVALLGAGARPRVRGVLLGLLVALVPILAWGIPALLLSEGRFWTVGVLHHVVARSQRPFEGHGGDGFGWWFFYAGSIPLTFLPWTLFAGLVPAVLRGGVAGVHRSFARILGTWVVLVAGAFTLSASKMVHYVLPAFPALALLVAAGIQGRAEQGTASPTLAWILRTVCGLAALALPVPFFVLGCVEPGIAACVLGIVFAAGGFAAAHEVAAGRWIRGSLAFGIGTVLAFATLGGRVMASLDAELVTTRFRDTLGKDLGAQERLAIFAENLPGLVFYLDRPLAFVEERDGESAALQALRLLATKGLVLVTRQDRVERLVEALPELRAKDPALADRAALALATPRVRASGLLLNRGRLAELVAFGHREGAR